MGGDENLHGEKIQYRHFKNESMKRKVDPLKLCPVCGIFMTRKRHPSGRLEDLGHFKKRKTCSRKCDSEYKTVLATYITP